MMSNQQQPPFVSPDHILHVICDHYGIEAGLFAKRLSRRQTMQVVEVKQVAAYFLWRYGGISNREISKLLGYGCRQSVMASRRQVHKIRGANRAYNAELCQMEAKILCK